MIVCIYIMGLPKIYNNRIYKILHFSIHNALIYMLFHTWVLDCIAPLNHVSDTVYVYTNKLQCIMHV